MRKRQTIQRPYNEDSFDTYLREVSKIPMISHEDVVRLSQEYHNPLTQPKRKDEIVSELATSNLRFVINVAKIYRSTGIPLEDLISAGNVGLLKAARKYDYRHGVKFISYAVWWIKQSVLSYIAENSSQAKIPLNLVPKQNRIKKLKTKLMETMPESNALNMALRSENFNADLYLNIEGLRKPVRLDQSYQDSGQTIGESLSFNREFTNQTAESNDCHEQIEAALSTLSQREQRILRHYFGLNGGLEMTLEEIGEISGVTRERIRQIKERALERLRTSANGKILKELHNSAD